LLFGLCLLLEPLGRLGGRMLQDQYFGSCLLGSTARLVQACTILTNVEHMYPVEVAQDNLEVGRPGRLIGRHWEALRLLEWDCGSVSYINREAIERGKAVPRKMAFLRIFAHAK
jgi:hypothetical protein